MVILAKYLITTWNMRMKKLDDWFLSHKLRIDHSSIPDAGLGVFATEDITQGEVIERAPVVLFAIDALKTMMELTDNHTILGDVAFGWNHKTTAISLGWGGIYNHNIDNNVNWLAKTDSRCLEYYAKKFIEKGEELFITYRHRNNPMRDFEEEVWLIESGIISGNSDQRQSMGILDDDHGRGVGLDHRTKYRAGKSREGCFKSLSPNLSWKSNIKS